MPLHNAAAFACRLFAPPPGIRNTDMRGCCVLPWLRLLIRMMGTVTLYGSWASGT
jgi:hypothetical protein